jgi:error-prone DNA polymerase
MVDTPYAELHAHTNFSLLDGSSSPEDMVSQAHSLGLHALAITDHNSIAGTVRFAAAAKHANLKVIIGTELTLSDDSHVVVLVKDVTGYENLCQLLTLAYAHGTKDEPHVSFETLAAHAQGLIALSGCPQGELPRALSMLTYGNQASQPAFHTALAIAARYRDAFGIQNYYIELGNHQLQFDSLRNAALRTVAKDLGVGCVATNDAHYHDASRALLHHVVTCIRHRTTLEAAGTLLRGNDEYLLKSPGQMTHLFRREIALATEERRPELDPIRTSVEIAERCTFSFTDLRYDFPRPSVPSNEDEYSFLTRLVDAGKELFYPNAGKEVEDRLQHELDIVKEMNLAGYLLVFKEVVDWSHEKGILCSIRGSAPASALLYCLGLCPIDPVKHNLLFERFCSPERDELPDIDLDFAHERREEVIQHTYEKYGRDCVAMVCEVNTYRTKSALRDVAKVLGLSAQRAQQLSEQVDWHDIDPARHIVIQADHGQGHGRHPRDETRTNARGATSQNNLQVSPVPSGQAKLQNKLPADAESRLRNKVTRGPGGAPEILGHSANLHPLTQAVLQNKLPGSPAPPTPSTPAGAGAKISGRLGELLLMLAEQLCDAPRHHSIHVGGMVISSRPLYHVCPIEPARMVKRSIIPWDKDDITLLAEEFKVKLIKMDFLGLGMLSLIARCFEFVEQTTGERLQLRGFEADEAVYDVICAADTVGLFQIESRAQQSFLPRLKPRNLTEVAISVGAIRPGPGATQAGEHIVRRKWGREPETYPAPGLEEVLKETYGVLLWQEQCIQVAMICAGYTPGQADQLRRAMSHKRSYERLSGLCEEVVTRMMEHGHSYEVADSVRKMIVGFAGYGFPRAHAYPFAHLALISATLRHRYPAAYYAAILNCQPMGFYAPHTLLWDAARHDVPVLPVDVNRSKWECSLEQISSPEPKLALRLGLKEVMGLGSASKAIFERERERGPFQSLPDFVARTGFDRETLERLAEVGAFIALPEAIWEKDRRATVWATGELAGFTQSHLPDLAGQLVEDAALPPMTEWEEVQADYRGLGYSLGRHVISYFRPRLKRWGAFSAVELPKKRKGAIVRAGGLVIVRQRPESAAHVVFLTLEDETGLLNGIVYPAVYERLRSVLRGEPLIVLEGPLQLDDGVTHILVRRAWPLVQDAKLGIVRSHDFH